MKAQSSAQISPQTITFDIGCPDRGFKERVNGGYAVALLYADGVMVKYEVGSPTSASNDTVFFRLKFDTEYIKKAETWYIGVAVQYIEAREAITICSGQTEVMNSTQDFNGYVEVVLRWAEPDLFDLPDQLMLASGSEK